MESQTLLNDGEDYRIHFGDCIPHMAEVMPPLMQEIERAASGIATGK